jgi:hypothetical protein
VILVLLGCALAWKTLRIVDASVQAQRTLSPALALATDLPSGAEMVRTAGAAGPELATAADALTRLQDELRPAEPLLRASPWLPDNLRWAADLPDALALTVPLLRASALLSGASANSPGGGSEPAAGRSGLLALATTPEIGQIAAQLDDADPALGRLRAHPLRGPLRPLENHLASLSLVLPELRGTLGLLAMIGPALGADGPRTYLLLGQNNREIRATGGFIGSVGTVTVDRGAIVDVSYGSSYTVDEGVSPPEPPTPYARYLGLGGWYLRDANWWADLPSSAAQVELAWQRAGHDPVDGVVTMDNTAVDEMLRALGPLSVSGLGMVDAENFEQLAAEQLYAPDAVARAGGFHRAKAAFLAPVGRGLIQALGQVSLPELPALRTELVTLLDEKHIQLALKDQRLIPFISARGWGGQIPPVNGDSLLVVDTTVSYGDTYAFVRSDVAAQVLVSDDGRQRYDLTLNYVNQFPSGLPRWMPPAMVEGTVYDTVTGRFSSLFGFWGNWLRVYVPQAAQEVRVDGLLDMAPVHAELGRSVIAGYLPLAPGERRQVRVTYETSGDLGEDQATYRLFMQKQAGLECRPVSLVVHWAGNGSDSFTGCPKLDGWIELHSAASRP